MSERIRPESRKIVRSETEIEGDARKLHNVVKQKCEKLESEQNNGKHQCQEDKRV